MTKEEYEASQKRASDKKKAVYEALEWGGGVRQVITIQAQSAYHRLCCSGCQCKYATLLVTMVINHSQAHPWDAQKRLTSWLDQLQRRSTFIASSLQSNIHGKSTFTASKPSWYLSGWMQMRDREQHAADRRKEASKPFARTKDDVDEELNLRGMLSTTTIMVQKRYWHAVSATATHANIKRSSPGKLKDFLNCKLKVLSNLPTSTHSSKGALCIHYSVTYTGRSRFGDPMAHLVRQKEVAPPPPVIPERMAQQMKKSGFIVPQASHLWARSFLLLVLWDENLCHLEILWGIVLHIRS